ncbi:hypothetical protein [Deinococcus roseus]|uniref:DUF2188 domain-containing protein n=1 Tax=Deinococcus roseus TaxID=392414 RepID=A0ABQ2CZ77_9DEIO|nr:hypothetical protein [Deinococcus roseus]GGJ35545.1 hypothetical protein GCM10008938_22070 [Deinococcus roseus]
MSAPSRSRSHEKPTYVVVMWLTEAGIWQGRIKALPDGREKVIPDMRDLLQVAEALKEESHAKHG